MAQGLGEPVWTPRERAYILAKLAAQIASGVVMDPQAIRSQSIAKASVEIAKAILDEVGLGEL